MKQVSRRTQTHGPYYMNAALTGDPWKYKQAACCVSSYCEMFSGISSHVVGRAM